MPNSDHHFCFHSRESDATLKAADVLARLLDARGVVINLNGDLGVGKTVFVKGLGSGLGLDSSAISSPSFTLVNEYPLSGGERMVHADFYRFESEAALESVGFLDFLEVGTVLVAEWGDRFPRAFPKDHLSIEITRSGASRGGIDGQGQQGELGDVQPRTIHVQPRGPRSAALAQDWEQTLRELADRQNRPCLGLEFA